MMPAPLLAVIHVNPWPGAYGVVGMLAFLTMGLGVVLVGRKEGWSVQYGIETMLWGGLVAMIGARVFELFLNWEVHTASWQAFRLWMGAGTVVLGGFIAVTLYLIIRDWGRYREIFRSFDVVVMHFPLLQAVSRWACFFAGCCFGMEFDSAVSLVYPLDDPHLTGEVAAFYNNPLLTETPPLFPAQAVLAFGNLLIYPIGLWVWRRSRHHGHAAAVAVWLHCVLRFSVEFVRNDPSRGGFLGLSTSQILTILIALFMLWPWIHGRRLGERRPYAEPDDAAGSAAAG